MKTLNDKDEFLLDLYLACNIAANEANLNIQEHHIHNAVRYLYQITIDGRRNPEYYYLACLEQVLKDEHAQLNTIFNGCV